MASCKYFLACLPVFFGSLGQENIIFAEQLTVSPQQSFLQGNQSVTLRWRYQSEGLIDNSFSRDFVFYHDGKAMGDENGGMPIAYPGKPYVDYDLKTNVGGTFTGQVGVLNATANVFSVKYEADVIAAKTGANLVLKCEGGPNGTTKMWLLDGVPVSELKEDNFIETYEGSLLVQNIELPVAKRRISCRQFFNTDNMTEYILDQSAFPVYKAAVTDKPLLVYQIKQSDTSNIVVMSAWKDSALIRVCYEENGESICKEAGVNNTVELDMKISKFTIFIGNTSLISDKFKGSEALDKDPTPPDESDSMIGIIIGVLLGLLLPVIGLGIFLIFIRKKKKLCFKEAATAEDAAGMKPLVPKDDQNGIKDAIELKELDKTDSKPAIINVEDELSSDEETNPLLSENFKKKEEKEEEKYIFQQPKYLQTRLEVGQDDTDAASEEQERQTEKDTYDFLVQLDAVAKSWDELKEFADKIDEFLESRLKLPAKPASEIEGSLYWTGKDILPRGFVSYESSYSGDCLFNSISSVLYGNENYTYRLRLASVWDGLTKSEFYIKQYFKDKDKDSILKFMNSCLSEESIQELDKDREEDLEYLVEFIIHMAVRETAISESKSNPLQVQFLSSAIDLPILQYFQKGYSDFYGRPVKDYEVVKPAGMTGSVKGQNKNCVCILWAYESEDDDTQSRRLNHIVPVLNKIHKH